MTRNSKTKAQDNAVRVARRPELVGYCVEQIGNGPKAAWTRVAAGWKHRDGQGYDIRLSALPVNGRLTLRFATEAEDLVDDAPVNGKAGETPIYD